MRSASAASNVRAVRISSVARDAPIRGGFSPMRNTSFWVDDELIVDAGEVVYDFGAVA